MLVDKLKSNEKYLKAKKFFVDLLFSLRGFSIFIFYCGRTCARRAHNHRAMIVGLNDFDTSILQGFTILDASFPEISGVSMTRVDGRGL